MTAAEISRIAGVTRATVSNWRRRHDNFPAPSGGTESSPLYDLEAVRSWLGSRGHTSAANPTEELRTTLRLRAQNNSGSGGSTTDLLSLVLAATRRKPEELKALLDLPDGDLADRAARAATDLADAVPGARPVHFTAADAPVLRALFLCVRDEGGQAALSALAERELEDSAASGTYQTPAPLADLAARLIPGTPTSVLDPACGSGALLAATARRKSSELYGQDTLPVQAQRSAVGLMITAPEAEVTVRTGDSLRVDAFPDLTVDAVLCNPPYGDRDWGHDELAYDPRWAYGVPARAESELAWVQHALAHLRPGGHAVLILPPATAGRASGRRVRRELVRSGALRAVVGLPAGAAPPLHVALQIWVLQRPEPGGAERKSVLFVDTATGSDRGSMSTSVSASVSGTRPKGGSRPAPLDWAGVENLAVTAWEAFVRDPDGFTDEPGRARAVPVVDLLDDMADLAPARHVRVTRSDIAPEELAADLDAARADLLRSTRSLARAARDSDCTAAGASAAEWRTATASDLARGGALAVLRTSPDTVPGGAGGAHGSEAARAVLTAADIERGTGPTGDAAELRDSAAPLIAEGDVLVRAVAGGEGPMARVAGEGDTGALLGPHVHLLRPDPTRLDAWCLAGFLGSEDNIAGASTGSTVLQVSPGRLRVPLLPLAVQRQYGEAFRRVHELRAEARRAVLLAEETARLLAAGLTGGQLLPSAESGEGVQGGNSHP
ncbi:N-6 DNA methylase [Streptomyces phyllanthi]|uniref:N-6 DNA methylase n=1 Tax=Streptomyces phyllanthi TaxID=1803180 RepID=A0A5N8WCX5_9ACTN|nr:N-6 DNA methylase [Streptomyces phyllanthi]